MLQRVKIFRRMVPVTYLFVALFGEGTRANEFAFAAWHRRARWTIELEGIAWTSRDDVLLCEWGESATKFTMNVSIKTSCFRSTSLLLSQVVDREGRIEAPPPLAAAFMHIYWFTGGSISGLCESVPRQILLLGLLVIARAARGT